MKLNFFSVSFIFSIVIVGSLSTIRASAQEIDPTANETKDLNQSQETNDDKALMPEHDSRARVRDSVHQRSGAPATKVKSSDQTKPSSTKEDDVLSFNFLYYIIQKFKISDLIDE